MTGTAPNRTTRSRWRTAVAIVLRVLGTAWFGLLLVLFAGMTVAFLTRPLADWVSSAPECSPPPRWLGLVTGVLAVTYLGEALLVAFWPVRRARRWAIVATALLAAQVGLLATYPFTSRCFQVENQLYAVFAAIAVTSVPLVVAAWVSQRHRPPAAAGAP